MRYEDTTPAILLEQIRASGRGTMVEALGIELEVVSRERMVATMPVGPATRQPFGLLHGGASVALAETLASIGAWLNVPDMERQVVVGVEINCNHIRSQREGVVRGVAVPLHVGRTTQVWSIEIRDATERLVAVSRCTLAVVDVR